MSETIFFKCHCGREQSFAPSSKPGGITVKEAESIGWVKLKGKWVCPICNFASVKFEVFVQNSSGNRVSCGKYQSEIENFTSCIDVRDLDLRDVISIHIEFSGRVQA